MKTELLDDEEVLAEEMANLFRDIEGVGGRLYVTSRRLIFEPHPLNFQRTVAVVPLEEIEDVRPRNTLWIVPNGMEVETRDGKRYRFVVWARQRLIDMIHVCRGRALWDDAPRPARKPPRPRPGIRPGPSVEGTTPADEG